MVVSWIQPLWLKFDSRKSDGLYNYFGLPSAEKPNFINLFPLLAYSMNEREMYQKVLNWTHVIVYTNPLCLRTPTCASFLSHWCSSYCVNIFQNFSDNKKSTIQILTYIMKENWHLIHLLFHVANCSLLTVLYYVPGWLPSTILEDEKINPHQGVGQTILIKHNIWPFTAYKYCRQFTCN